MLGPAYAGWFEGAVAQDLLRMGRGDAVTQVRAGGGASSASPFYGVDYRPHRRELYALPEGGRQWWWRRRRRRQDQRRRYRWRQGPHGGGHHHDGSGGSWRTCTLSRATLAPERICRGLRRSSPFTTLVAALRDNINRFGSSVGEANLSVQRSRRHDNELSLLLDPPLMLVLYC